MSNPAPSPADPSRSPKAAESAQQPNETAADASAVEDLETVRAERDAHWDKYLRAEAELENYRRRVQREREEDRRYAALPMARDLLPTLDNLLRAVEVGRQQSGPGQSDSLLQGVEMISSQLLEMLERFGIRRISAQGQPFDPHLHEAIQQQPSAEFPPHTVLQEVETGFVLHDRVIRPCKVIVSSGPPATPSEQSN